MKSFLTVLILCLSSSFAAAQGEFQAMVDADRSLASYASEVGAKTAYLKYLGDDGVIFKPEATNGKDWWNLQTEAPPVVLKRTMEYADIAANGLLGYTTGVWEETAKPGSKGVPTRQVGQYITVWSKKPDGKFYAIIDVMTQYDEAAPPVGNPMLVTTFPKDINKRRWSAADPSMKFLRMGMDRGGLGNAFDEWAAEDVRLIIEENPPIYGKKNAVKAMKKYLSVAFPRKVSLLESADLAYAWNPCEYANSEEGMEKGTCLNIWKLRSKKWYITLGAFARVPNVVKPMLKTASGNGN
jgi:ketosteroid isomerase-like protein